MNEPIHDRGYQLLFSNPILFRQLLESFVKAPWVAQLDFDSCEKLNKSFISKEYEKRESDLIYKIRWREQTAYIVILVEFQSTVQRFMAIRIWRYLAEFYTDWIETHQPSRHEKLPPVFPIMLYNGDSKWTAPDNIADLIENNEQLGEFALQFKYLKIVENEFSVEQLLAIGNIVSTLFLAETHYDFDKLLDEFIRLFKQEDRTAISLFINWFKQLALRGRIIPSDYQISLFINWFKQLALRGRIIPSDYQACEQLYYDEQEVSMLITALRKDRESLFQQGIQQGIQQGEWNNKINTANAMLAKGFESMMIAELLQLPLEEIERLQHPNAH